MEVCFQVYRLFAALNLTSRYFQKLNQEYGPIVYLQMGSTPLIVLGDAQTAWDLLEKRSQIYSSRPKFWMGNVLLSDNMRGLMSPINDFWRRWRKVLHAGFMQKSASTLSLQATRAEQFGE